jgi:hypothetical protein
LSAAALSLAITLWAGFTLSYVHHGAWTMRNVKVTMIDQGQELAATLLQTLAITYFW